VLALLIGAYHESIATLLNGLRLESPLAYLAAVPALSLFLAMARAVALHPEPQIHDRTVDYLIGVPLLLIAMVIVLVVPIYLSTFFWLWRLDLLSLPFFAAGAVALAFGSRALWRLRLPLAFLLLAWPAPYTMFFSHEMEAFTTLTIDATRAAVGVIPLARPLDSGDGSLFLVTREPAHSFVLSVGSACAGINGMVGFLLVAGAALAVFRGSAAAKLGWLCLGLGVIWILDVMRILTIFAAGRAWGESFTAGVVHPLIGILFFNLGLLAMVGVMPLFRLRSDSRRLVRAWRLLSTARGSLGNGAVARPARALAVLVLASLLVGFANAQLPEFERVSQVLGPTRIQTSTIAMSPVPGWSLSQVGSYAWVKNYMGADATWRRYNYAPRVESSIFDDVGSRVAPITLDVISTSDLGALSTHSLEACYRFYSLPVAAAGRVDLGAGVIAKTVTYRNQNTESDWTILYWEWPVKTQQRQFYERVVLYMVDPGPVALVAPKPPDGVPANPQLAIANAFGGSGDAARVARPRDYLIAFGRQMILAAASAAQGET
jgi:exosortase/archaeosortase family protein